MLNNTVEYFTKNLWVYIYHMFYTTRVLRFVHVHCKMRLKPIQINNLYFLYL